MRIIGNQRYVQLVERQDDFHSSLHQSKEKVSPDNGKKKEEDRAWAAEQACILGFDSIIFLCFRIMIFVP